ncbi:putative UDP-glycosyltransferase 84B2-like [Sesbania bispinosa]|nr:putative UDP-glycosyltransferase 84B2-like [Sesbania bispinosa]
MASSEKNKEELHVLPVAFSSQGHINPLLRLGKSLLTRGLHVTFATTEFIYHSVFNSNSNSNSTASDTLPTSFTTNGIHVLI